MCYFFALSQTLLLVCFFMLATVSSHLDWDHAMHGTMGANWDSNVLSHYSANLYRSPYNQGILIMAEA